MVSLAPHVRDALTEVKAAFAASFGPRLVRVVLFGSYARGRVHEDSDIDVLVLVSPRALEDGHRAADAAAGVMLRRPDVVISPIVMTPEELEGLRARERRLARDIDREGVAL